VEKELINKEYEKTYLETGFGIFDDYERNRLLRKLYHKQNPEKEIKILDLAAGDGHVCSFFQNLGYDVFAMEWCKPCVEKLEKKNIKVIQKDVEELPYDFPDNYFDEIFWGDNVEHLFYPLKVSKEIKRILKPGGRLVLSTPNHGWIMNRLYYFLFGVPRKTEGYDLPIWEWQHIRYFNKRELVRFLKETGFEKKPNFYATDRRKIFELLSKLVPSFFGSILVAEIRK
jgi:SAM-dependent methyltransferase